MNKVLDFFKVNRSYKNAKCSLLVSLLVGFLSYNQFIFNGYTNPDGIIEGLTSYVNATWHIAGCGRWVLPIIQSIFANINVPFIIVVFYCFFIWLSAFTIAKIWDEENNLMFVIVISAVMCVTRTTFDHITTNSIAISDSIACFLSTYFVYAIYKKGNTVNYLISIACICLSLGIFQPYVGLSASLVLMTIIILLIKGKDNKIVNKILISIVCAICGVVSYFVGFKVIMFVFKLNVSGRMEALSFNNIIGNLFSNLKYTYYYYFQYFNDQLLHKNFINFTLIILIIISIIFFIIKNHNKYNLLLVTSLLLIPLASNLAILVMPEIIFVTNMCYQNVLIVPFGLCIVRNIFNIKTFKYILTTLAVILCWLNILCVNATLICYKLSYESIKYQMSEIISDVIHKENYSMNETPVLFVGYPNDSALRNSIPTYKYAYDFDEISNVVFWENEAMGYTYNRQKYVMDYFGIDIKDISFDEYLEVIHNEDFKKMKLWPNNDGIKMINGIIVVKLTDNPFVN